MKYTQPLLQSLIDRNKKFISALEDARSEAKAHARSLYQLAEKNSSGGKNAFETLNMRRDQIRDLNLHIKHFATIQKVLRTEMKGLYGKR